MSGHSHWAGIKHKKAANDAKRGKVWSKCARNIIVAAKNGGADPDANLTLRYAIDKAKEANMPKDTIDKAIKKGAGELDGVHYEEVVYEGYGPSGVAIMCDILTDNRNRTAPELRKIFERRAGSLGASGCVSWMFSKKGIFNVKAAAIEEDKLMELVLEAGADDFQNQEGVYEITCAPEVFQKLKQVLADNKIATELAEISQIPSSYVEIDNAEVAKRILDLMEELEDNDDVQSVSSNFDIPDEIMKKLS